MAGQGEHCAHSFRRCWRVACAQKFCFFYAAEIAAAKMLLFFRESVAMDILTKLGVVSKLEVNTIATEFFESPRDRPVSGRYCKRQNTFSGVHLIENGGGITGNSIDTRVPRFSSESTLILPPIMVSSSFTNDKPKPAPLP